MNKIVTIGLGTGAVVVLLFVGAQLFGSPSGGVGSEATPTPGPITTAEPSPSVAAALPEGPHVLEDGTDGGVPITVTIASPSWNAERCWSDPGGRIGEPRRLLTALQGPGPACAGPPDGAGLITFQSREYRVYGDACHYQPPPTLRPNVIATTVDELVDALAGQVHRRVSTSIEEITVDGYVGKQIILQLEDGGIYYGNDCERGQFALFGLPDDALARYSQGPRQIDELWIVDVDGLIVVLDGLYYPDTPQNVVDELRAILASATIGSP